MTLKCNTWLPILWLVYLLENGKYESKAIDGLVRKQSFKKILCLLHTGFFPVYTGLFRYPLHPCHPKLMTWIVLITAVWAFCWYQIRFSLNQTSLSCPVVFKNSKVCLIFCLVRVIIIAIENILILLRCLFLKMRKMQPFLLTLNKILVQLMFFFHPKPYLKWKQVVRQWMKALYFVYLESLPLEQNCTF